MRIDFSKSLIESFCTILLIRKVEGEIHPKKKFLCFSQIYIISGFHLANTNFVQDSFQTFEEIFFRVATFD